MLKSSPATNLNWARNPPNPARAKLRRANLLLAQGCCMTALLLLFAIAPVLAQTLARPGLAGSGLNPDPWWMHAVFYRIGERTLDISLGAPKETVDFKAITAKLDALQSLGIDALIVPMPQAPQQSSAHNASETAVKDAEAPIHNAALDDFDELIHQASSRGIRVLLTFPASGLNADLPAIAQLWLNHGIAGFHVVTPAPTTPDEAQAIVQALRKVTNAAVGQRIVISDYVPDWSDYDPKTQQWIVRPTPPVPRVHPGLLDPTTAQLEIDSSLKRLTLPDASSLRSLLLLTLDRSKVPPGLLLDFRPPQPPAGSPDPYPALAKPIAAILLATQPAALLDTDLTDALREPRGATDAKPASLADWYRQLAALHHENATLRYGSVTMLDYDDQNALVWVKRGTSGAVTTPPIFVACNLSAVQVKLSLADVVSSLKLHGSFLRTLLRSDQGMGPQDLDAVTLPPFGVYIGELGR
jgi:alpha-glucosidase